VECFYSDIAPAFLQKVTWLDKFLILPIKYHKGQPISENLDNFTLQRGFRVYKVEGFFTGDRGLKQLPQSASFEVIPNYF
jgi:hypothetical protein